MYLPTSAVAGLTEGFVKAGPLLQTLAADPSLRGALNGLSLGLMGVQYGQIQLDQLARPMSMASETVEDALAGRPVTFSWQTLASGEAVEPQQLRRYIEIEPVLDFTARWNPATPQVMRSCRRGVNCGSTTITRLGCG